ncbi:MAG: DNA helicase PcrA [Clostridia bacterium]|nr:DNA helicase PcrA [Clostridia bacterium]
MDLLEGLNKPQYEAVTHTEGPLLVIAGAGSGKTRVLTHRIAYLISEKDVKPWNIIAITFTNKAAKEMKERIGKILGEEMAKDMWVGTFHSMCVRILRREIEKQGYERNFLIFDTSDAKTVIKECLKELEMDEKIFSDKYILSEISKAKNDLIDPVKYENKHASDYRMSKVAKVYSLYQTKLKKNNAVDFDDIINITISIFKEYPEVLEYYQDKFKYVLVDEYQDTNKAQDLLIALIAEKNNNVCVVGDDQQSIYKFRGADIGNILSFENRFKNTHVIKLEQNYRSTKSILNVANEVIKNNAGNVKKNLWTDNDEGKKPKIFQGGNEYDEANYVVSEINHLKREEYYKYSDFTILYRTNAQSRVFEEILMREGIPYKVVGGLKFYDRKEIKDIMAYLRVVANTNDNVSLKRIINEPKRKIGKTTLDAVEKAAEENGISMFDVIADVDRYVSTRANATLKSFAEFIKNMQTDITSIETLTQRILKESGYMKALEDENTAEAESRIENLGEFLNVVISFENENADNTLTDFLENLALVSDLDSVDEEQENVLMMTLHTAKGLEFPVVFMVGMEDGLFPSYKSIGEEAELEEERRLCYVGITRAKEYLYMSCAKSRTIFGSTSYGIPSRFLTEIPVNLLDGEIKKKENNNEYKLEYEDDYSESGYGYSSNKNSYGFGEGRVAYGIPISTQKVSNAFSFKSAENFLQKLQADDTVNLEDFKVGKQVEHKKFGQGTIIGVEPEDDDLKVEIQFEKVGMKRLMAKYAGIKIL